MALEASYLVFHLSFFPTSCAYLVVFSPFCLVHLRGVWCHRFPAEFRSNTHYCSTVSDAVCFACCVLRVACFLEPFTLRAACCVLRLARRLFCSSTFCVFMQILPVVLKACTTTSICVEPPPQSHLVAHFSKLSGYVSLSLRVRASRCWGRGDR